VFEEFFDGILASAEYDQAGNLTAVAHDVEVHHNTFKNIWDDAWQMIAPLYMIDFHHNLCLGAGPSVDAAGSKIANTHAGTVYIHHNVIDTTTCLVFWGRDGFSGKGMYEAIPFSSHGSPKNYTWPRKLYYNTIVTGPNPASYHHYVGWSLLGAKQDIGSQALHEVYNNIFLVKDGRFGGKDFVAYSGREIYDGNVYWNYGQEEKNTPWQSLWVSTQETPIHIATIAELRTSQACEDSRAYYAPGWEYSGLNVDPDLDSGYKPREELCKKGAVDLTELKKKDGWPGIDSYEAWRGAINPL
jgi:hypothetical protein